MYGSSPPRSSRVRRNTMCLVRPIPPVMFLGAVAPVGSIDQMSHRSLINTRSSPGSQPAIPHGLAGAGWSSVSLSNRIVVRLLVSGTVLPVAVLYAVQFLFSNIRMYLPPGENTTSPPPENRPPGEGT